MVALLRGADPNASEVAREAFDGRPASVPLCRSPLQWAIDAGHGVGLQPDLSGPNSRNGA